jgi:hypothetical protein
MESMVKYRISGFKMGELYLLPLLAFPRIAR